MMTTTRTAAALAVAGVCLTGLSATGAKAGSELMPGISTGIPLGAPLPEGLWSITIPTYGWRNSDPNVDVGAIVPAWLIWSTPYRLGNGVIMLDAVMPYVNVDVEHGPTFSGMANAFIDVQVKWDLGNGFFGGFQSGIYLPIRSDVGNDYVAWQGIAALSYLKDGWDLSSTFIYGTGAEGTDGGPAWFNVDLTATKKFGKFEIGAVGFGSTDLSTPFYGYEKQSQFALGALIGYDFDLVNVQLKLTRDVYQENYGGYDTRVWANIIVPLMAPTSAARPAWFRY
ncbi:transporter [Xanthobacter sediminis]